MNSNTASRAWSRLRNLFRSSNSHSRVAKKLSHIALSYASPTEPIDGRTAASLQRSPNAIDVYCSLVRKAGRLHRWMEATEDPFEHGVRGPRGFVEVGQQWADPAKWAEWGTTDALPAGQRLNLHRHRPGDSHPNGGTSAAHIPHTVIPCPSPVRSSRRKILSSHRLPAPRSKMTRWPACAAHRSM